MDDGLTHYLHYLYPESNGYLAVQELPQDFQSGGVFAIPVMADGSFFSSYRADYIKHDLNKLPVTHFIQTTWVNRPKLLFEIGDYRFEFSAVSSRPKPYLGKLKHHDFLFNFIEIETPFGLMDSVFNESKYLIVGCSSFNYQEVDTPKLIL